MVLSAAVNHAHRGIQNGTAGVIEGAQKALDGDLVQGSIDQTLAAQQIEASSAVMRAVDESLGTLLDDLA